MLLTNQETQQAIEYYSPKLYLSGFPKSGLHLANRYVLGMGLQPNNPVRNWLGTNPWTVERFRLDDWIPQIVKLLPGQFIKGHTGWLPEIEFSLVELGIGVLFVYRDLRDVVVSQMHHVLDADQNKDFKHPNKEIYRNLDNEEEVMIAIIEGIGEFDGIIPRWETYAPWLDSQWALSLRFEEMVSDYYRTANKIYDYATDVLRKSSGEEFVTPHAFRVEAVRNMIDEAQNKKESVTFRKGKTGGWREVFTPRVIDAFKKCDNGWLVRLGYEKDEQWQ